MKNFVKIVVICGVVLAVLLFGISVVPFERWTGIDSMTIIFSVFMVILGAYLIGLIVFVVINRRKKIVEVVEFSAPDDMTPADAGYVIDRKVDDRDVSALLIYWAQKKYLQVDKQEDNSVTLKKLKDADEHMKVYEKTLFNAIFQNAQEVNLKDLPTLIHPVANNIRNQIKVENDNKYFSAKKSGAATWMTLGITCMLIFLSYFLGGGGGFSVFCGFVIFIISTIFSNVSSKVYVQRRIKGIVSYFLGILLFLIFAVLNLIFSFNNLYALILVFVTTVLCLLTYILCPLIEFRNEAGKRVLGSLLGLKNYIELAEKEKMEKMVHKTPDVFYQVMPYAYVLNVSNEWIEEFNFVKTIDKKNRKETTLALGLLVALFVFGDGVEILGGLFGGGSKQNKKVNKKTPKW